MASSSSSEKTLAVQLRLVGNALLNAPSSADEPLTLLDDAEDLLANMEQEQSDFLQDALLPVMKGLIAEALFKHPNEDVRVTVASCLSEILRITSPEQPFNDDQMKAIFQLIVDALSKLSQPSTRSYEKALSVLETIARVKGCLLMLDLKCEALVLQMCQHFWLITRSNPSADSYWAMEQVMADILAESEDISPDLLVPLLVSVPTVSSRKRRTALKSNVETVRDQVALGPSYLKDKKMELPTKGRSNIRKGTSGESGQLAEILVGLRIKVWWPLDEMFHVGLIQSYDPLTKKHKVLYDDGDVETLNLEKERWEFIEDDLPDVDADNPKPVILANGNGKSSHSTRIPKCNQNVKRLADVEAPNFSNHNIGGDESGDDESTEVNVYKIRARLKDVQLENPSMSTSDDDKSTEDNVFEFRARSKDAWLENASMSKYNNSTPKASPPRAIGVGSKDVQFENPITSTSDDSTPEASLPRAMRLRSKDVQFENPSTSTLDDLTPEASPPRPWGLMRSRFRHH